MSDLIQRLKTGCVPRQTRREDTPEDLNEPFNIGATNALMAEAAAEIERLNILIDGAFFDLKDARQEAAELRNEAAALKLAIIKHHEQRADDRCIEDDDRLYAAAGLPPCDRRVGSKEEMLANCKRFVEQRCEGGGPWKSYRELEGEINRLTKTSLNIEQITKSFNTEAVFQRDDWKRRLRLSVAENERLRSLLERVPHNAHPCAPQWHDSECCLRCKIDLVLKGDA